MKNKVKEKLKNGELVIGTFANLPCGSVADVLARVGFDFVVVDLEPGAMNVETCEYMIRAIIAAGGCPIVRVLENSPSLIFQALELGAYGIHVPDVDTKEEAEMVVEATRFPPIGNRSVASKIRQFMWNNIATSELDKEILVIVHIESVESMDNLEEIISLNGIDVAYVGPNDLSQSMGIPGQGASSKLNKYYDKTMEHLKGTSIYGGVYVKKPEMMAEHVARGYKYLAFGSDIGFLYTAGREAIEKYMQDIQQ